MCKAVFFNAPASIMQQDILKSMILESDYHFIVDKVDKNGKILLQENLTSLEKYEFYILRKFHFKIEVICSSDKQISSKFADMLEYAVRSSRLKNKEGVQDIIQESQKPPTLRELWEIKNGISEEIPLKEKKGHILFEDFVIFMNGLYDDDE